MAQFVTHIQPTLVEASHHHIPHQHHKDHHKDHYKEQHKDYYEKHHKDGSDVQQGSGSKDHHGKEKHEKHGGKIHLPKLGHSPQHYPLLPATPSQHHEEHAEHEHKRDSGRYLDSHGIPHSYQLHFIDSQGIHRDYHGHVEDTYEHDHHEGHHEKDHSEKDHHSDKKEYYYENEEVHVRRAVPEDRSPFEKSPSKEDRRPTPPQFISLHASHSIENKNQTVQMWLGIEKEPTDWGWIGTLGGWIGDIQVTSTKDPVSQALLKLLSCKRRKGCSGGGCTCQKVGLKCSAFYKFCRGKSCQNVLTIEIEGSDYEEDIDKAVPDEMLPQEPVVTRLEPSVPPKPGPSKRSKF